MAALSFVPAIVFNAKMSDLVRTSPVLDGSMEALKYYAEMHNLTWVNDNKKSGITDRFLLQYGGYWFDSVGNVFIPE